MISRGRFRNSATTHPVPDADHADAYLVAGAAWRVQPVSRVRFRPRVEVMKGGRNGLKGSLQSDETGTQRIPPNEAEVVIDPCAQEPRLRNRATQGSAIATGFRASHFDYVESLNEVVGSTPRVLPRTGPRGTFQGLLEPKFQETCIIVNCTAIADTSWYQGVGMAHCVEHVFNRAAVGEE